MRLRIVAFSFFTFSIFTGFSALDLSAASPTGHYTAENGDKVFVDEKGMPRCIERTGRGLENYKMVLGWASWNTYGGRGVHYMKTPMPIHNLPGTGCRRWPIDTKIALTTPGSLPVAGPELDDFHLDMRSLKALRQLQHGGNEFREEETAKEWLSTHPVPQYTRELNLELSERFGMGFSADVYRNILWAQPKVKNFAALLQTRMKEVRSGRAVPIKDRFKNAKFLIAKGYLQGLDFGNSPDPRSLTSFLNEVRDMVPVLDSFTSKTGDDVQMNAPLIAKQIMDNLDSGTDLVLICASKGCVETLGALGDLGREGYFAHHRRDQGRILGVMNMSALDKGSFFADWATRTPQFEGMKHFLKQEAKANKMPVEDFRKGLRSIGTQEVDDFYKDRINHLPKELFYLNFIGISNENGFAGNEYFRKFQDYLLSGLVFPKHGANDALVEYPGLGTTEAETPNSVQLPFNSGHSLVDGTFMDVDMGDPAQRGVLMKALMGIIAERNGR